MEKSRIRDPGKTSRIRDTDKNVKNTVFKGVSIIPFWARQIAFYHAMKRYIFKAVFRIRKYFLRSRICRPGNLNYVCGSGSYPIVAVGENMLLGNK
jgi:hypothetical protein